MMSRGMARRGPLAVGWPFDITGYCSYVESIFFLKMNINECIYKTDWQTLMQIYSHVTYGYQGETGGGVEQELGFYKQHCYI